MKCCFLYFPSYALEKNNAPTLLENKLKEESKEFIYRWVSVPQAQEEFDLEEYINLLQRILIDFIQKNSGFKIKIIGASLGAGILHYILTHINLNIKIEVFLFKPVFLTNLEFILKLKEFKCTNYNKYLNYNSNEFFIHNCDIYYVFGDKDLLTKNPNNNFYKIDDNSKILVLANSTHQTKKDEFPDFEKFYLKFLET